MTERLSERERIASMLQSKFSYYEETAIGDDLVVDFEAIADWHLAEVKRIVEPFKKSLDVCK